MSEAETHTAHPEPDDFVCFAIYSAAHAFNRFYKPLLDELDLTYPQYLVMTALWAQDDQTVGSLGEKLFLESNTLTPLLKRLEKLGYLDRARDPADERQVRLRLTGPGRELQEKAKAIPACVGQATGLSLEAVERLRQDIATVRGSLLNASAARFR